MFQVEIDEGSGFCFGVTTAIKKAEEELHQYTPTHEGQPVLPPEGEQRESSGAVLYCLGGNRGSLLEPCSTVWATLSTTQWRWNASPNADS